MIAAGSPASDYLPLSAVCTLADLIARLGGIAPDPEMARLPAMV